MTFFNPFSQDLIGGVKAFISHAEMPQVQLVLLYFYSSVTQASSALFAISGIFAIFRIQAIDSQLRRSFDCYRDWINVRIVSLKIDPSERDVLQGIFARDGADLLKLGVNIEPDSWLEKDMIDHSKFYYEKAKNENSRLLKALTDYFKHFKSQHQFKFFAVISSTLPILLMTALLYISASELAKVRLCDDIDRQYYVKSVCFVLDLLKYLLLYFCVYIPIMMLGPFERNTNNPKTNN